MALERHEAGAAIEVPGTAPLLCAQERCIFCGQPDTGEHRPPVCSGCKVLPFSTPASKLAHRAHYGPPAAYHCAFVAHEGSRYDAKYADLRLALVLLPVGGTKVVTVDARGAVLSETVQEIRLHPWREVVIFRGHRMWIETLWSEALQEHVPATHDFRPEHYKADMDLANKGYQLLKVTRGRGNPNLQRPDEATVAKRDNDARKALKLKKGYPHLRLASIAKTIGVPHGTLKDRIADYLRRYPTAG